MRIVKALGAIIGVLLLALVVPVLIGILGRSAIAIFSLLGLAVVVLVAMWWRNLSAAGRRSRLFGKPERRATQRRQQPAQNDAMRQPGDTE